MTVWNGDNGATIFYQSELPYDVDVDYGTNGYASYKVGPHVQNHIGYGIGVYSYYRDHPVVTHSGIQAPEGPNIEFTNSVSVFLGGSNPDAEITHIVND